MALVTTNRIFIAVAGLVLTVVGAVALALGASPASAHTGHGSADCTAVYLTANSYDGGQANKYSISLDGAVVDSGTFGSDLNKSVPVPQDGATHDWATHLEGFDGQFVFDDGGTVGPCGTPPTTEPPTTPPTTEPPTSPPTTVPPTTEPPTTPPTTNPPTTEPPTTPPTTPSEPPETETPPVTPPTDEPPAPSNPPADNTPPPSLPDTGAPAAASSTVTGSNGIGWVPLTAGLLMLMFLGAVMYRDKRKTS